MSELQLSPQLIQNIQQTIVEADQSASDPGVTLQYLAAVSGYMLGMQDMPDERKDDYMEQLCAFAKHVMDDVRKPAAAAAPAAKQQAFGYWEPSKA
ncbi:MAG: hypothetical protein KZQ58_08720 [gamma proteobacterium symbiont of Bathyaustriella thionipta]|nr:hypothetical protein [gamma proteobacterium symbiont of Bathyaustriella thionipta]